MINSRLYNEVAKTVVADHLLAAEHARTRRAAKATRGARRQQSLPAAPRGVIFARRFRTLARVRTA